MVDRIVRAAGAGLLGVGLIISAGCSFGSEDTEAAVRTATNTQTAAPPQANPDPQTNPTSPEQPGFPSPAPEIATDGRDQLDISGATLLGTHRNVPVKSARITRNLYAASIEGSNVRFSMDNLGWPVPGSPVGGVNARTYIFWKEGGRVIGGMFEWQRPGQTVKTLQNIKGGYLDGRRPPRGAQVWFMLSNIPANERTNVILCQNPWQ
ncbi:MAG TPA: hypothetical protein PKE55_03740 [Kiritimatiellia bacterium]|nr:hypothetical protein [Kiritimatiellia bacterium]